MIERIEVDRGLLGILKHGVPGHSQSERLIVCGQIPGHAEPAGGDESDHGKHRNRDGGRP
jgi:hypothetical protein